MKNNATIIVKLIIWFVLAAAVGLTYLAVTAKIKSTKITSCASNLKAIGMAMSAYANDFDAYPSAGGENAYWSNRLGWKYDADIAEYMNPDYNGKPLAVRTTTNLYLLIRYQSLLPEKFVCPATEDEVFSYPSLTQNFRTLWDFGDTPFKHCSYSTQRPFSKYPITPETSKDMSLAADRSPFFDNSGSIIDTMNNNSQNHGGKNQNILFNDLSVSKYSTPNVGVQDDDIYKFGTDENVPTDRSEEVDAQNEEDSFLVM